MLTYILLIDLTCINYTAGRPHRHLKAIRCWQNYTQSKNTRKLLVCLGPSTDDAFLINPFLAARTDQIIHPTFLQHLHDQPNLQHSTNLINNPSTL